MTSDLLKWSGFAALAGGALTVGLDVWDAILTQDQSVSAIATTSGWVVLHVSYLVADVLILLALVGVWLSQAKQVGVLGIVGFLMAFAGTVMLASLEWSTAFLFPWLAESASELLDTEPSGTAIAGFTVTVFLVTVGWVLFGVASLRARVHPRGPVWLVIVGAIGVLALGVAEVPFLDVVWGLGLAWLGYGIWSGAGKTREVTAGM